MAQKSQHSFVPNSKYRMNRIEIQNKTSDKIDLTRTENTALNVLETYNKTNSLIEIIFTDDDEIQELNKTYRQIDKPTDILSFPQTAVSEAKIKLLGSLVISLKTVEHKKENLDDVIKHGILHLLGFDHEEDEASWEKEAKKINCNL